MHVQISNFEEEKNIFELRISKLPFKIYKMSKSQDVKIS